jgi:hypothetical protein
VYLVLGPCRPIKTRSGDPPDGNWQPVTSRFSYSALPIPNSGLRISIPCLLQMYFNLYRYNPSEVKEIFCTVGESSTGCRVMGMSQSSFGDGRTGGWGAKKENSAGLEGFRCLRVLGRQDQEKQGGGLMVLFRRLLIFDPMRGGPPDLKIHQLLNPRGVGELPGLQHGAQIPEKNQ